MTTKIEVNNITKEELLSSIAKVVGSQLKQSKKTEALEEWQTINEVSKHLKQSISTIRKLVDQREIPFRRFKGNNSTLLFKLSEIDEHLNKSLVTKKQRLTNQNSDRLIK